MNRDLWWAHTGGGTGNFGIVTRYWFRSPGAESLIPSELLPKAPEVETIEIEWDWKDLDEIRFSAIVRNFGRWIEANSGEGIVAREFFGTLILANKETGKILLQGLVTDTTHAEYILDDLIRNVHPDPGLPYQLVSKKCPGLPLH